jgi:signal transduction histidine kinase
MIPFKRSLRLRVAVGLALFSLLIISVQSIILYEMSEVQEEELIDLIVAEEMGYLIDRYRHSGSLPYTGGHLQAYVVHNDEERAALPDFIRGLPPGSHEVFDGKVEYHTAVRNQGNVQFYLLYDVTRHDERIARHHFSLAILMIITALVSIWLSFWLASLLVRQVTELAKRVADINPGVTSKALVQINQDEEVASLARAVDSYQQRMGEFVLREQEFTANVSHELRTPLTSIQTSCELLARDNTLQPTSRLRLESITRAAERISQLIQKLLYLARHAQGGESEDVQLQESVKQAVEPLLESLTSKRLQMDLKIDPLLQVHVNRQVLHIVLSNLIKNAVDYTDRGGIEIYAEGGTIFIKDSGQGIAPEELPHIFKRLYRTQRSGKQQEGFGLGLAIVKRLCDQYGWDLNVKSAIGSGTTFSVTLPVKLHRKFTA